MLSAEYVIAAHDNVLRAEGGLSGFSGGGPGAVDAALARIDNRLHYENEEMDDAFAIAAMYAVAIARAHAFNDGNKRTALICTLEFLRENGYVIPAASEQSEIHLAELMVGAAEGAIDHSLLRDYLVALYLFP
ncbi:MULTISPECIES: type II toxin-antitoxin system death-on-curing family toxin [Burkholderiaceae]|uniref:type II toxin-antitoxin system death-on-curing family toxin n=1 Tax=Burkholderiaceae TaxID=119060 RepID=UPI0009590EB5|nr:MULTISPECIES: type II toxin-antitoxin system death-on-curing family toxin [Burkholderiaceae]MCG1017929.1 type II toxin-antitoxin system death-on-curing family toxin [Mycetohabitans sp. B4]SIT66035.1 death on curing protein [Burkholderia sp. b13]SIT75774.1 death on curing protein [Burkholderia sp. b13]